MNNQLTILNENKPTLTQLVLINMPKGSLIEDAERLALKEITNFEMVLNLKPELANCDPNSILLAVKQCITDNLTLAPNAGLVYLYPGKICVGTDKKTNAKIYKEVLMYDPTAEGRLSIARQSGTILDHKRPVCTYDGNGQVDTVTIEFLVPSYREPRWEKITFNKSNFAKWMQKSAAKFGGTANANYTSWNGGIDPEFAGSKAIKHGLKKRGTNANEVHNTATHVMPTQKEVVNTKANEKPVEKEYVQYEEVKNDTPPTPTIEIPDANDL